MTHLTDPNNMPPNWTELILTGVFWAAMALWVWWPWRKAITPSQNTHSREEKPDAPPTSD